MVKYCIKILDKIIDLKNAETKTHTIRVGEYTKIITKNAIIRHPEFGIKETDVENIRKAALVHDIGKIRISNKILNKAGKLTKKEYKIIKAHTIKGGDIIKSNINKNKMPLMKMCYWSAMYHHERIDGKGYPKGLMGDKIPIYIQIISIADVYDALTSERCYHRPYSQEETIKKIKNGDAGKFDDKIIDCIESIKEQLLEKENELKKEMRKR